LKKNFTKEPNLWVDENGKKLPWKIPNFSNEQTVIENFKKNDLHEKKGYEMVMRQEAAKEMKLERFIQK